VATVHRTALEDPPARRRVVAPHPAGLPSRPRLCCPFARARTPSIPFFIDRVRTPTDTRVERVEPAARRANEARARPKRQVVRSTQLPVDESARYTKRVMTTLRRIPHRRIQSGPIAREGPADLYVVKNDERTGSRRRWRRETKTSDGATPIEEHQQRASPNRTRQTSQNAGNVPQLDACAALYQGQLLQKQQVALARDGRPFSPESRLC
jgi:hypothetical protein